MGYTVPTYDCRDAHPSGNDDIIQGTKHRENAKHGYNYSQYYMNQYESTFWVE